jgi:hypothetical protein
MTLIDLRQTKQVCINYFLFIYLFLKFCLYSGAQWQTGHTLHKLYLKKDRHDTALEVSSTNERYWCIL